MTDVRANLLRLTEAAETTLNALSRATGRNDAYLHQFVHRGTPRMLPEDVRLKLAMVLRCDERLLGAREERGPS